VSGTTVAELTVALRVYPGISKEPAFHPDDKLKLFGLSIRSLVPALEDVSTRVVFLLDRCPPEYRDLIEPLFQHIPHTFVEFDGAGNHRTFSEQIDILSAAETEYVCFAEDDYLYRAGSFRKALDFMRSDGYVDFVTLYDHSDYYQLLLHDHPVKVRQREGQHWREASSTTLSFITRPETVRSTRRVLESFCRGNHDAAMWMAITKTHVYHPFRAMRLYRAEHRFGRWIFRAWQYSSRYLLFGQRRSLFVPVPALATHLESSLLSPGVDWDGVAAHYE